jgi:type III pantothenate kinase
MNLAIDVGNSSAKAALFEKNDLKKYINRLETSDLERLLAQGEIDNVIISSVSPIAESLLALIPDTISLIKLHYQLPLPIRHLYQTPATLGMDRVAAVVGATVLFPTANRLVLDAGTCITYDFIDQESIYHGGSISLGLQMRFRALHEFTAKLPLFSKNNYQQATSFIGNSTETSIVSGVINGIKSEIEGFIRLYVQKFGAIKVVFCGGDGEFLMDLFKGNTIPQVNISYQREILLIGLNHILQYNLKK